MEQLAVINPENVSPEEVSGYSTREAARAIVTDEDKHVALLHVANENYYKLPGGGIEESEDPKDALERECREEIGSEIDILDDVGFIVEYRRMFQLKQTSYCYLAKLRGQKGQPQFTEDEVKNGFEQIWVPYNEALNLLLESNAISVEGKDYIVPRDLIFLKAVRDLIK